MVSEELSACNIAAPTVTRTPSDRRTPHPQLPGRQLSESGGRTWSHNWLYRPAFSNGSGARMMSGRRGSSVVVLARSTFRVCQHAPATVWQAIATAHVRSAWGLLT